MVRASNILFFLIFLVFSSLGNVSYAQDPAVLTEESIKDFIQKTSEISKGKTKDMSTEDVKGFLRTHLHDSARFKSNMTYNIPGYPPRTTKLALNKDEFIESIESGDEAVDDYEHSIQVKTIKISSDKRKATVLTAGREKGLMKVNQEGQEQKVPIIGSSSCNQIIMLSDENVIQMFNANCSTEIVFQDF